MKMDKEEIKKILPHREPMLYVDEVDKLIPMEQCHGYKQLTRDMSILNGHYPNNPVVPGIFYIESLAQLCNIMILSHEKYKRDLYHAVYAKLSKIKFYGKILPEERVELSCQCKRSMDEMIVCMVSAKVKDQLVFEGEYTFMVEKL